MVAKGEPTIVVRVWASDWDKLAEYAPDDGNKAMTLRNAIEALEQLQINLAALKMSGARPIEPPAKTKRERLLEVMELSKPYTIRELLDLIGDEYTPTNRRYALDVFKKLVKAGIVEVTTGTTNTYRRIS